MCVTLQNCKIPIAPSSFGIIFAQNGFGHTDTRALLTFPTIKLAIVAPYYVILVYEIIPPSPRLYCSISINGKFPMWVFSGPALLGIAISTFRITPLEELINWFEMTRAVQLSNYAWLKALVSDAITPKFSQMKYDSLMQFDFCHADQNHIKWRLNKHQ